MHDEAHRSLVLDCRRAESAMRRTCAALHTTHKCKLLDLENFESLSRVQFLSDLDEILTQGSWLKVAFRYVPPHEFWLKLRPWQFFEISSISFSYIWGALRAPQILHIAKWPGNLNLEKFGIKKELWIFSKCFWKFSEKFFFCLQLIFGPSRWV